MKHIIRINRYKTLVIGLIFFQFVGCEKYEEIEGKNEQEDNRRLPQISINTNGAAIIDDPKINASIKILELGAVTFEGKIGIEIRGASSQSFPKKSYGFETRDASNNDLSVSFFGLPEEEDWILYGPYSDKTLLRNVLMYDLSRDIGRYASRTVFVELSINNANQGVYVLMEKLKRDQNRININKLNPDENTGENLTGGYILKIDKLSGSKKGAGYNESNSFPSQHVPINSLDGQEVHFLYEYPKAENITSKQRSYIQTYISQFENALASDTFTDSQFGYAAYIDASSFIDFFLLNELANNVDAYRLSTFMSKDINEKLKIGPIWDFNLGFGNANYCGGGNTNSWAYRFNEYCPEYGNVPFWWDRLLQDPAFVAQLKIRWNTLRNSTFSETLIFNEIDSNTTLLKSSGAVNKNFQLWNVIGLYVWPNNYLGATYDEEVEYLKEWIQDRLFWMDGAIQNL